jgi:hypothetical protein
MQKGETAVSDFFKYYNQLGIKNINNEKELNERIV